MRGGYLYQHCPDVVPQGFLTPEEVCLWVVFHERRAAEEGRSG